MIIILDYIYLIKYTSKQVETKRNSSGNGMDKKKQISLYLREFSSECINENRVKGESASERLNNVCERYMIFATSIFISLDLSSDELMILKSMYIDSKGRILNYTQLSDVNVGKFSNVDSRKLVELSTTEQYAIMEHLRI